MGIFSGALRLPQCNYSMTTSLKRGKMEPGCMRTMGLELSLRPPSPEVVSVRALVLVLGLLLPEGAFSILIPIPKAKVFPASKNKNDLTP